jgi:ABC-type tungstate transport system substrate-binding protein
MARRMSFLFYLFIMLVCIIPLTMSLGIATHGQLEHAINCLLSTEVITPTLIVGVTLIIFFARKAPGT